MEFKFFEREEKIYWGDKKNYTYFAIGSEPNNNVRLLYVYDLYSQRTEKELLPSSYKFIELKSDPIATSELSAKYLGYKAVDDTGKWREIPQTVDGTRMLMIPNKFKDYESISMTESVREGINDKMLAKLKTKKFDIPTVLIGEDLSLEKEGLSKYVYFCPHCKIKYKQTDKSRYSCPNCGALAHGTHLIMKDYKDFLDKEYLRTYENVNTAITKDRFYFMAEHPDNEDGIILYKIVREVKANKGVVDIRYAIEYSLEYIIGQKMICYKHLKKSIKECDSFEALNINTKNITYPINILYDDCDNFFEFATKHQKFLKMSGFQSLLKFSSETYHIEGFFIVFLAIMQRYPVMEQIVKMGHSRIYFNLYNDMRLSLNKDEIARHVEKISQLVDNEASKGKDILRFPTFIGDYLIKKDAPLEEYYYWRDIYEITHITKEQFEKWTDSFNFAWINSQAGLADIGNIIKFDYPIEKLFSYIIKSSKNTKVSISRIITYLSDYLNMCDIAEITPDKFPKDLVKVHNDMADYFRRKEHSLKDKQLETIGTECEKYVIPDEEELDNVGIPKLFKELTIVFPKSEYDFIDEGTQQHNCVGSYPSSVRNGKCVIFFIRKKESPEKSFITAECKASGLGQCFYSNNRYVSDEEYRKFASYISKKINAGIASGKIHALSKISN